MLKESSDRVSDVLKIATLFSCTCYDVNRDLDAIVKLRSFTFQAEVLKNFVFGHPESINMKHILR